MNILKSIILSMTMAVCATAHAALPADEGMARAYCDTTTLQSIEGIWEFPEDDTRVLIMRDTRATGGTDYNIVLLSTPDCRLTPGTVIGTLEPSADAGKFDLSLCRQMDRGIISDYGKCTASLKDHGGSLLFHPRKFKIALRSMQLLPKFWKALRFNIKEPEAEVERGMVRVYPVPYGSGTVDKIYL